MINITDALLRLLGRRPVDPALAHHYKFARAQQYWSAEDLAITEEEWLGLVAFANYSRSPIASHYNHAVLQLNGSPFLYTQDTWDAADEKRLSEAERYTKRKYKCNTAGCVAGYVLHHIYEVQHKNNFKLDGKVVYNGTTYGIWRTDKGGALARLYQQSWSTGAADAAHAVDHYLRGFLYPWHHGHSSGLPRSDDMTKRGRGW